MPVSGTYRGRRAATIENANLRVTVLVEGGHIAEVFDKQTGINPLWSPTWPSIEASAFEPSQHREIYGDGTDAKLLAAIMGHNVCLDIFGGPSDEEAAAGLTVHGEAPVVRYEVDERDGALLMRALLPLAELVFERRLELDAHAVNIRERVTALSGVDRPIGWTQHVTLGPPFLEKGRTTFRCSATRSLVFEGTFGLADYLKPGATFDWPDAPRASSGTADLRVFTSEPHSSGYTAHLMNPDANHAFFVAFSPSARLALGYVWKRSDFPWMGIWEENYSRTAAPWNGQELTRGMEFGVSPFPETRRASVDRARLFDTPTYRWLPARSSIEVEYRIVLQRAVSIPESM